ncbi:YqfO family protein [Marinobacterium sp. D7]|uniref:Nif3-like dinuclear metal center hexameric protein n=1 Tax=Marinobacterium ramblicola TaxID=2849041 RepID=UPI001C2CD1A5|nr:YqfO family protein [Marinobacterium ramblicola]MBV1788986.1 YqfO family protein [Marinobacterium ramblicola]
MFKLCFFVPDSHLEVVKQAIFEAGAGRIGDYDQCCWQTRGIGQFRPLDGANPHLGQVGELEQVEEWKVELVCDDDRIQSTLMALRKAHPYEEVAYDLWRLIDPDKL